MEMHSSTTRRVGILFCLLTLFKERQASPSPSGPIVSGFDPRNPPLAEIDDNPLVCEITGGNPLPTLSWTRDGVAIPDSQIQTSTSGSTVTSQLTGTLQAGDNGKEFVCTEQHVDAPSPPRSESVTLNVYFPSPSGPTISGDDHNLKVGDDNPLQCEITGGNPLPTLEWDFDGNSLFHRLSTSTSISGRTVTSRLLETIVADDDGRTFRCTENHPYVDDGLGARSASATLSVNFPSPYGPVISGYNPNSPPKEGDNNPLECEITGGNPRPSLSWTQGGYPIQLGRQWVRTYIYGNTIRSVLTSTLGSEDNGEEFVCIEDHPAAPNPPRSDSVTLNVYFRSPSGPTFSGYNASSPPQAGYDNPLQCQITGGNPLPTLRWTRDGVAVPDSQIQTSTSGSTVTSQLTGTLQAGDNGKEFVCTEQHVDAPNPQRFDSVTLRVYYLDLPSLTPSSPSVTIQKGGSVSVLCTVDSVPTATLKWTKEGSDEEIPHGSLMINNINRTQSGNYFCVATNIINSTQTVLQLIVIYKPELTITPLIPVHETDSLTLTCTAASNPDVTTMSWTHVTSGRDIPGEVEGNVLTSTIQEVTYEDAGNYSCSATNSVGWSIELVDVIINYAPKFTHTKSKYTMGLGQNVTMECSAIAYPNPITFSWSMDETKITTGVTSQDGVSTITVKIIQPDDYGDYNCTATNSHGGNSTVIQLVAEYAPEPSMNVAYTKKTGVGVVTLTWTAGFNGGLETTHTVQYRLEGTTDWVSGPSVLERPSQNRREFIRTVEISEKGRYEIRIQAENRKGAENSNVIQILVEENQILYGTITITNVDYTDGVCEGELSNKILAQLDSILGSYKGYEGAVVTGCRSGSVLADFEATVAQSESAAAQETYTENLADRQLGEFIVDPDNSRISDTKSSVGNGASASIIIIAAVVSAVVLIAVIVAAIFLMRRHTARHKPTANAPKDVELEDVNPDEAAYEDVKTPLEFPRNQLAIKEELGHGGFGRVNRAEAWNMFGQDGVTVIAVKAMKAVTSPAALSQFFQELSILNLLGTHPNVVSFLGCCTDTEPFYLLLEYVSGGSLQSNLRTSRTQQTYGNLHGGSKSLSSRDLIKFGWDVARGMSFLSSKKILHRDLATRNVLVSADRTCKVSDFGFSREGDEYKRTTTTRLPIRWMALESLFHRKYTTKSDVWAFGVLLWEIVTLGATPYPGMSKREVMDGVQQGYRMDKPTHCDGKLYTLMLSCWDADPARRPEFRKIQRTLDSLMEIEDDYINLATLDENTYTSLQTASDEKY